MLTDVLKTNIASLGKYNYSMVEKMDQINFSEIHGLTTEEDQDGCTALFFYKDKNKYLLHSKHDPHEEAMRIIRNIEDNKDSLIVVFGIGLGYHLFALQKKISQDSRVIVVEHNLDILKYALINVDLSSIFGSGQFGLVAGDRQQIAELMLYQLGSNFYNLTYNIQVVISPNYYVYNSENLWAMKRVVQRLNAAIISFGNDLGDVFTGFRNSYLNVDAAMQSNSINEVRDKYKNIPAIIVASGPSLDKNIQYLKAAYGKALIIACDASMKACEGQGVKPDAVASVERDEPTYNYYYMDRTFPADVVLVGPPLLWPNIYAEYPGKTIMMCKNHEGTEAWWASHFDSMEFVNLGQSSATVAFAVAKQAGCNPIILIGQDLAFSEGKKHSNLTHTEHEGVNDDRESDGVYLEDYEGNLLRSDWAYKMFKEWYENQISIDPAIEVIDATEGGAYIHGSRIMTLQEAIDTYCVVPLEKHLVEHLSNIVVTDEEKIAKYETITNNISGEMDMLKKIKKKASVHYKRLLAIEKKYDFDKCNNEQLVKIVSKMQPGDKIVQGILNTKDSVIIYYRQIIVQTIMHVKKIGNDLTKENVKRNYMLQKNLMYILNNSTDLILKEYEDARIFLKTQKAD